MKANSIVLVGAPDSGKTNYLGRLWAALRARQGKLAAPEIPPDIQYVEQTLEHLMHGDFAPRSDKSLAVSRHDFVVPVKRTDVSDADGFSIVVPDVSGELWKSAVETFEISEEWMEQLQRSIGALLFVRVLSNQNVTPLDWVTAERLLKLHPAVEDESHKVPTQVMLCELLRFLEYTLQPGNDGALPRVAIVVTAWDLLDVELRAAGPMAYLQTEYPLFVGKLADTEKVEVKAFGVTIVGGDFEDQVFRTEFLENGDLQHAGHCVVELDGKIMEEADLTYPVAWLVEPLQNA